MNQKKANLEADAKPLERIGERYRELHGGKSPPPSEKTPGSFIRYAYFQLGRESGLQPKQRVTVCEQMDGRVRLFAGDRDLSFGTTRSEPSGPGRARPGHRPVWR